MKREGITIQITPGINDDTAELALKVVQLYCNSTGCIIENYETHDGRIKLFFKPKED